MAATQLDCLKEHLRSGRSITPLEAFGVYSIYRLAARVKELRNAGWSIETITERDRKWRPYASYRLLEEPGPTPLSTYNDLNPHGLPAFALPDRARK